MLHVLELAGLFVFAMSGVLTAGNEKMDLFGAAVIGFVTAVGGGTLRDILIGSTPVGWMVNCSGREKLDKLNEINKSINFPYETRT
ncbi:MAG: hypothetical protein GC193_07530 [Cryomorphaceae bacterium]|nr:hypothetical protein [Cryomorphaceae bacterium]